MHALSSTLDAFAFGEEDAIEVDFEGMGVGALAWASFSATRPSCTNRTRAWLKRCIPSSMPAAMAAGSFSR